MIQTDLPPWPDRDKISPLECGMTPRMLPARVHEQDVTAPSWMSGHIFPCLRLEPEKELPNA